MNSLDKTLAVVEAALDKKAYDLRVLQVEHLNTIADYFVVMTGRSDVQVQSIARGIEEKLGRAAVRPIGIEGFEHGYWIVMDYDDVVIHVLLEQAREFYRLDSNWTDALAIRLPEPFSSQARELSLEASA